MSWEWKAGDLAVCVNEDAVTLQYRSIYRVEAVTPVIEWNRGYVGVGLILAGFRHPLNKSGHFCSRHFRPVEPAEPAFTNAMRELRPLVEA